MAWYQKLLYGVDLDEEQKRQDELDRQLAALNKQRVESGGWDQAAYDLAEANRQASYIADVAGQVDASFGEGWHEGAAAIRGETGEGINTVLLSALKIVPWQLWLLAGLWLFLKTGGVKSLKKAFR